jgi:hypothetical protein
MPFNLVKCPDCAARVRADRMDKHLRKIHGKVTNVEMAKARNATARRSAEARHAAHARELAANPRKCAVRDCKQTVIPPEEYCDTCKKARIGQDTNSQKDSVTLSFCRTCDSKAVPGEVYCYACLGD